MAENKELFYLRFASDFWTKMYRNESLLIEGALRATADTIKSLYFSFLQRNLPGDVSTFPVFQEHFWNVIELLSSEAGSYDINFKATTDLNEIAFSGYSLDEPYANIPLLYNLFFEPTVILRQGTKKQLQSRIDIPNLADTLVIGEQYVNFYDYDIICGADTIIPKGIFTAKSDFYTVTDILAVGYVVLNRDYCIDLNIGESLGINVNTLNLESRIYFRKDKDPFINTAIAQRVLNGGDTAVSLFAPKAYLDYQELMKIYGAIVGVFAKSSIEYRDFITGILNLYQKGPMVNSLNVALNVCNGYPVARTNENIISIAIEPDFFTLKSDKGNIYKIKRTVVTEILIENQEVVKIQKAYPRLLIGNERYYKKHPQFNKINGAPFPFRDFTDLDQYTVGQEYTVFWSVKQFDGFIDQLKVVDYQTQEKWWLDKIANGKILEQFVQMSDENRGRKTIIDFLFENYLKFNTFGVFVDSRILSNFQGVSDFIKIINDCKPTYKTFLVNEQDLSVFSEVEIPEDSVSFDSSITIETVHDFPPRIGMAMYGVNTSDLYNPYPVPFGIDLHQWGSAYDFIQMELILNSELDENENPLEGSIFSYFGVEPRPRAVVGLPNFSFGRTEYGEVTDWVDFYIIDLDAIPEFNLTVNSITFNSAVISWDSILNAIQYRLFITDITNNTTLLDTITTSLTYNLTGLVSSNDYEVKIKAIYLSSESNFSDVVPFTTLENIIGFIHLSTELTGDIITDSEQNGNDMNLTNIPISGTFIRHLASEATGNIGDDVNNNDMILADVLGIEAITGFTHPSTETTGNTIGDSGLYNNDMNLI